MSAAWLCFYFFWGWLLQSTDIEYLAVLLEAISDAVVVLLILEQFIDKVLDGWGKGLVVVLAIAVNDGVLVLEGGLVAVERYLFDCFGQFRQVVVAVDLEELDKFLFLEGGDY